MKRTHDGLAELQEFMDANGLGTTADWKEVEAYARMKRYDLANPDKDLLDLMREYNDARLKRWSETNGVTE